MEIRSVNESDLPQINDIYNWHSENGFSTFSDLLSLEKRKEWLQRFDSPKHIALLAEENKKILGIACSFAYRGDGVFRDTVETSIYLDPESRGKGIGSRLYSALFESLQNTGIHRIVVGIALPNQESIAIHKKFGFEEIGIFDEYAYYKGEYRSSVWMQKKLQKQLPSESFETIHNTISAYKTGFWLSDMANFSSIVFHSMPEVNWAGFYLDDGKKLRLGPFCGKPACTEIAYHRGVCGAAFTERKSMLVDNVLEFPGHISCDSASRSELVIPVYFRDHLIGVFDLDSPKAGRFTKKDQENIEQALAQLLQSIDFYECIKT